MSVRWKLWDRDCFVWFESFFTSLLLNFWEKGSGRYSNSYVADAPGKLQHPQLVSHLLTRGVRNRNKDSYDPSDLIPSKFVCFVVRHKWQTHRL